MPVYRPTRLGIGKCLSLKLQESIYVSHRYLMLSVPRIFMPFSLHDSGLSKYIIAGMHIHKHTLYLEGSSA